MDQYTADRLATLHFFKRDAVKCICTWGIGRELCERFERACFPTEFTGPHRQILEVHISGDVLASGQFVNGLAVQAFLVAVGAQGAGGAAAVDSSAFPP